jgi:hypothetical protein
MVIDTANSGVGIYYISRMFGKNETLLYIGIAYKQKFKVRLNSHFQEWLHAYRGKKFVRFGEIIANEQIARETLVDIESALIFEIEPIQNINKKCSYKYSRLYSIENKGYRGELPYIISMKAQIQLYPSLIKHKASKASKVIEEEEIHPLLRDLFL